MSPRHEFKQSDVEKLLVECHRRCCVCHRFCGVKIEVDHIESATGEGSGDISSAIPLCFDCHAEVHHYNPKHPKGHCFSPAELRAHRAQWLELCASKPQMFVHAMPAPEAGSLERILGELEVNLFLTGGDRLGGAFEVIQFRRAIADGTFAWLDDELKFALNLAYKTILVANSSIEAYAHSAQYESAMQAHIKACREPIDSAILKLQKAL